MITNSVDLNQILEHWTEQASQYSPSAYVLLLCGDVTEVDRIVFDFAVANRAMLDDMTGPYVSLTLVGWRLDQQAVRAGGSSEHQSELEYLHAAPSWSLGSPGGVYSLVNALNLPLNQLPLMVVSLDPWTRADVLVTSLRDVVDAESAAQHQNLQLIDLFSTLVTAARTAKVHTPAKRLRFLEKQLKPYLLKPEGMTLAKVADTGILAQLVEGVIKGLGLDGG